MATGTVADWISLLSDYGLGDDITPDDLIDTINKVIQDVNTRQAWPFLETTATVNLTIGNPLVTLPARFSKSRSFVIDSLSQVLTPNRRDTIIKEFIGSLTSTGCPFYYYFIGQAMYVYPVPDQAYVCILDYDQDEQVVTTATALSSLLMPTKHHDVYILGCIARLSAMEDDTEMYGLFSQRFEKKIVDMMDDLAMHQYDMPDIMVDVWDDRNW